MPTTTTQTEYTKTWMLFESGNGVTVDLSLHEPPREKNRPIDAYVVTECEGDFTGSARRAAEAVYNVAKKTRPDTGPMIVGYDLHGLPSGMPVAGSSGGLAFAIALAKRLFKYDPGPVAATGEVKTSHNGGPIGRIRGIKPKLEAACSLLPEQGWVFYPKDNDGEIPDKIRRTLADKGIKLRPVSSVAEALDELFEIRKPGDKIPTGPPFVRRPVLMGALLLILLVGIAGSTLWMNGWNPLAPDSTSENITSAQIIYTTRAVSESGDKHPEKNRAASQTRIKAHDPPLIGINIAGKTPIASNLAQLLSKKLADSISADNKLASLPIQISGQIVILEIMEKEKPMDDKTGLYSSVTARVSGLTCSTSNKTRSFSVPRVCIKGKGPVKSLLQSAAMDLAGDIINELKSDKEKGSDTHLEPSGFE